MGSAAQRRGAYGGEYLRARLRLRARGGRRIGKITSQTRARKDYREDCIAAARAEQKFGHKPRSVLCPFIAGTDALECDASFWKLARCTHWATLATACPHPRSDRASPASNLFVECTRG
jgi:hypothetical protein